jgi:hypothetical protein
MVPRPGVRVSNPDECGPTRLYVAAQATHVLGHLQLMFLSAGFSEQLPCPRWGTKMDENGVGLASIEYGR